MSYEKVKRLKIANGKIIGISASNNVRPLHYAQWEIEADEHHIRLLFKELCGNCLQPLACCRWWNNLMKLPFMDGDGYYIGEANKPSYWDSWCSGREWNPEQWERNYQQFRSVIREKYKV